MPASSLRGAAPPLWLEAILSIFPDATLVEPSHNGVLPSHEQRRPLCTRMEGRKTGRSCILFTDPAHSTFVVSWRSGPARIQVEYRLPARAAPLEIALAEEARALSGGLERPAYSRNKSNSALARILRDRLSLPGGTSQARIHQCLSELTTAEDIRRAWKVLHELKILDPLADDEGRRLISSVQVLEPIHLALLARTRSLVDDELGGRRHRPEFLSDLRKRVDLVDEARDGVGPRTAVRRDIIRKNVFALCPSRSAAKSVRKTLARHADLDLGPALYLDCNVAVGPGAARTGSAQGKSDADPIPAGIPMAPESVRDPHTLALVLAWRLVRARRGSSLEQEVYDGRAALGLERYRRAAVAAGATTGTTSGVTRLFFPWLDRAEFTELREGSTASRPRSTR